MMKRAAIWVAAAMGAVLLSPPPASAQARRVEVQVATPYVGAQVTFAQRYSPRVYSERAADASYRSYRRGRDLAKRNREYLRDIREARRDFQRERRRVVRELRRDVQRAAREYARYVRDARRDWRW
jgi:hypothetical protein